MADNYLKLAESLPGQLKAEGLANTALTKKCRLDLEDKRVQSRSWESNIWSGLPTKLATETFLDPEFRTPGIDAGTILSGSYLKTPWLVSDRKQNIRIESKESSISSRPPLNAFLRGRIADGPPIFAKMSLVPQLEWNLNQGDTKVRVTSAVSPRQILFVLDCSNSFDPDDHASSKDSLLSILDQLPEENTEVGLLVFGHLAQWKPAGDGSSLYAEDVAANLRISTANRTPENDIDLLVSMKKLNDQTKKEFQRVCDSLKQFGFTPLHASIDRGREELRKAKRADFAQHLVVITDGGDNVYTDGKGNAVANNPQARKYAFKKLPKDIKLELSRDGIKGHCVKYTFDTKAGIVDSIPLIFEEKSIYDASNKDQLKRKLRSILDLRTYSVGIDNKVVEREFGETFGVRLRSPAKLDLKVVGSIASQEVLAKGGEYYDVRFDPVLNTFRFAPLDEPQFGASVVPQDKSEPQSRVCVLAGDREGLTQFVRFGIVPMVDSQPPRRPARIWAEMKIVSDENAPERVVNISDVQWESEKKSPVFRIPIQQGKVREIRVWLSFQEGNPNRVFLNNWRSKDNQLIAERMAEPERSPDGTAAWSLTLKPPAKDRIRWSIRTQASNVNTSSNVEMKRIKYTLGPNQAQTYTFTEQPSDVEIVYENMPEADRPNTDRWLTTEWLKVP